MTMTMLTLQTDPRCAPSAARPLPTLAISREACQDYQRSSRLEWLETNGTGGFAMGTVSGANTRRYHGLLAASLRPPVERYVMLAKLDEAFIPTIIADISDEDASRPLSTNQYPGAVYPEGYKNLFSFRLDPFPTWIYRVDGFEVEKRLFLLQDQQTVVVEYRSRQDLRLRIQPLVAFRDYHALAKSNARLDPGVQVVARGSMGEHRSYRAGRVSIRPYAELPVLTIHHSPGLFEKNGCWHYDVEYLDELDRGLDFREDLYRMGTLELEVGPDRPAWIIATVEDETIHSAYDDDRVAALFRSEVERRRSQFRDPLVARLEQAADQFLVRRADGTPTAIAGYPWFADWGRDTMIALPGLLLARGHHDEAAQVIRGFLKHMDRGVIPNRFSDHGEAPEYNTADATLWMFQSVAAHLKASGDESFVRDEFYPSAREIFRHYREGTHHGIRIDARDCLLIAGDPGTQLTWMDAKVGEQVMTPRHGKPVEINALYYNALRLMQEWAERFGHTDDATAFRGEGDRVADAFSKAFWNQEKGCLHDVITPDGPDARLRPNQIFAVSLPYPLMTPAQRMSIVSVVDQELVTHVGLRTLSPRDKDYNPHYRGGPRERDAAYHQGIVWPWLLGPFIRAYLGVFGRSPERIAYCRALFHGLELHLEEACLGTISEIFEAEAPYRAVGAPAQAWSVAALLDVLIHDLLGGPQAPVNGSVAR
jgi:predicted glycogen debranching enzyme